MKFQGNFAKVASSKEGVISLCMSAEDWSASEGEVDRVVIRGALHHFTRWASFLAGKRWQVGLLGWKRIVTRCYEEPYITFYV